MYDVLQNTRRLFEAKINSGKYDDYTPDMLNELMLDCLSQCEFAQECNYHRHPLGTYYNTEDI